MITFVSKSGTNAYHGTAYDFIRNDDLDSRNFFAASRSIYKQNDFGASLGGPVRLPKLYHRRDRRISSSTTRIPQSPRRQRHRGQRPTPEMYKGDFRTW